MKLTLVGKILDKKLKYKNAKYRDMIRQLCDKNEGLEFIMTIQAVTDAKTLTQLRFYRGVVIPAISKATGETNYDKIHRFLKSEYLVEFENVMGKVVPHIPSLELADIEIDRVQMAHYIERCLNALYDLGGRIEPKYYTDDWR